MSLFLLIGIFFLGACVGSFSAVLLEKNSLQRSFWRGRSQCLGCKKTLEWYELIPLVSYALQGGKCRGCDAKIPRWIWFVEWYMAFLWMIVAMMLLVGGFGSVAFIIHIGLFTWLSLLVIEDMRFRTISDERSIPLMIGIVGVFIFLAYSPTITLLPTPLGALAGAVTGMLFYMIQMILPALSAAGSEKRYRDILSILLSPLVFPVWLVVKTVVGEKKADTYLPLLDVFERGPVWVGGGDIRLGIIIGALVGPYHFLYVVMYGYILGTLYFLLKLFLTGKKIQTLPVAPLLFFGLCVVWCLQIFA